MKTINRVGFFLISFFFMFQSQALGAGLGTEYTLSGQTMGTYYTIKFISKKNESLESWQARVDMRLNDINKKFSMFDPKSQVSMFNRQKIGTCMTVSSDFHAVLLISQHLYHLTHGAWDGTIKPLVDLWGFGTQKTQNLIPGPSEITLALSKTGFDHIRIKEDRTLCRTEDITLDLGSIAKGYGVDALAALFMSAGIQDVLVEIGGELYAAGNNKKGDPWAVGITTPDKDLSKQGLYKVVRLNNQAIATSGNYRNFFEINGKRYSHIIDPKTGFPVDNGIVSASVISSDCTFADGLATALMVMDVKDGLSLVNRLENTECLILKKNKKTLETHLSNNFHLFFAP